MMLIFSKKKITLLLIVTIVILSSFSISYALLNQRLSISGTTTVLAAPKGITITNISNGTFKYNASETSNSSKTGTTASFGVSLPKGVSTASYDVTTKNNSSSNVKFSKVNFTSSNSAFTYELSGISTSTIIAAGGEITFKVIIKYLDEYKYSVPSTVTSSITMEFEFGGTSRETFKALTGTISPSSGDLVNSDSASFVLNITNSNDFPVTYTLEGENGFVIYNSSGEVGTYYLGANSSDSYEILIKEGDTSIAEDTTASVGVIANVEEFNNNVLNTIGTVTLSLKNKNKYIILGGSGGIKTTPDNVDYSSSDSSSSSIYAAESDDGYTYYYRGKIDNNYFSFAGYTWRIMRIDSKGNVRLILNDFIRSNNSVVLKQFKSTYTASSVDAANTLLKVVNDINDSSVNSPIYGSVDSTDSTTLRGWYNANIKSYEEYIVDSKFCLDTSGGHLYSQGAQDTVFYYGPYQRIGKDASVYAPEYLCQESDILTEKVGLLSSDEYVFAGGAYATGNSSIYLNDFGSSNKWWTLSPGYYDSTQKKVGAFIVLADGSITDWPDNNTVTNTGAIRPVITVNGNLLVSGSGTKADPYKFS